MDENQVMPTPEEARAEIQRRQLASQKKSSPEKQSSLKTLFEAQKGWVKGLGRGLGQGIGDIGASIGNVPADITELQGHERPYSIPHPDLLNKQSSGLSETVAQEFGQHLPRLALEAFISRRLAPFGGRNVAARIGLGAAGGGAAGAASSEQNRAKGFGEGALVGATDTALTEFPLRQKTAGKAFNKINSEIKQKNIGGFHLSPENLQEATKYLKKYSPDQFAVKNILKDILSGEYNPAFKLQSGLNKIANKLYQGPGEQQLIAEKISNLRGRINSGYDTNLINQGHPEIAQARQLANDRFRRHHKIKPIANRATKIVSGTALGSGTLGALYKLLHG